VNDQLESVVDKLVDVQLGEYVEKAEQKAAEKAAEDAHLPCETCDGDGRARPNEHGAYVGGDPENCSRCGGTGTSYDLACPSCSERTPDHLMCECPAPVCTDCCAREHPRRCPDCRGEGAVVLKRYRPAGSVGPFTKPCETCQGTGTANV